MKDSMIYAVHAVAWGSFGLTRMIISRRDRRRPEATTSRSAIQTSAPYSRALLGFHSFAFGVLYFGLADAVVGGYVPRLFPHQRAAGALLILAGGALMCWTLVFFRSWRFRAQLEVGHELATGGPFTFVRHPIYAGINLIGLGTAAWAPAPIVVIGALLLIVGSDLRGRAEEKLLTQAFGDAYRTYMKKAKRLIPGIY